jgi:hypothetical protein
LNGGGIDVENSSFAMVTTKREVTMYASLKRNPDRSINIKIFAVEQCSRDVSKLKVHVVAVLDVPKLNKKIEVLDLTQCRQLILSLDQDKRSGIIIALAGEHWLTVKFVKETQVKVLKD